MYIKGYKAIHTVKPATKEHQKKNTENYLFQPTFWFRCKNKREKTNFAIKRDTFPFRKKIIIQQNKNVTQIKLE